MKFFFLLWSLACVFSNCQRKPAEKYTPSHILNLNLTDDPASLDPRRVRSLKDLTIVKQLFEGLMRLDEEGIPQLALAEKIEISEDKKTYTFTLRESYWTNGDPVTAADFVYAWRSVLNPSFACDYSYLFYPIKNAKLIREGKAPVDMAGFYLIDSKKFAVELEHPTAYFLELLAFPTFFPINFRADDPQKKWSLPPGDRFVCNGPFCIKKWKPQEELVLQKNDRDWDAKEVTLEQLCFTVLSDNATEGLLYEKGQLDWLGQPISHNISPELLVKLRRENGAFSYPVAGTFWFKFNVLKPPFDNQKVRQAFSYDICRQEIISHILLGNQTIATGPTPPSMSLHMEPYFADGDTRAARELFECVLKENQLDRATFPKVVLHYTPSERNSKIVQLVQQQWEKTFGIPISIEAVESHVYRRKVQLGDFQVGTGEWIADFNDPLAFLELFKYTKDQTGSGFNDCGWQNVDFNTLLDRAEQEKDIAKRKQFLSQAEKKLIEEMPIAPVYHYAFDYAKKNQVKEVVLSPLGIADFKKAKKEILPKS